MKNIIYQCWQGYMRSGCLASKGNMEAYAARIGSDYRFDENPNIAGKICEIPIYYEWLNVMLDEAFMEYDNVMSIDMDVFTVKNLEQSIFEEPFDEIGICTEPFQPDYRANLPDRSRICGKKDETWAAAIKDKWNVDLPRNEKNLLKVYNAGVVVFSNKGLREAKEKFIPFQEYIDFIRSVKYKCANLRYMLRYLLRLGGLGSFYRLDQNYFHAMLKVANMNYTELHNGWNSYIHYAALSKTTPVFLNDSRTDETKFVHIQLPGADDYGAEKLHRITNLSQSEWTL